MDDKKNVSLNEMMDRAPREKSSIDLTQGRVEPVSENDETEHATKAAHPINSGSIDMDTMAPVDTSEILPKRKQKSDDLGVSDLFSELDAAVDRECASISERIADITKAQEEENQKLIEEAEMAKMAANDEENINHESTSFDDDDFSAELGLAEEDDISIHSDKKSHISAISSNENNDDINPDRIEIPVENDNNSIKTKNEPINPRIVTDEKPSILDGLNDEDLFNDDDELSEDDNNEKSDDQILNELKEEVKSKINPIKKTIDLSKFRISKKSINASKAMKLAAPTRYTIADWALISANRAISMTSLSGPEILKLNPENSSRNRLNTFRDMYRVIYDHVYDGNKPEFETWLKQTRFVDLQHIYFALYMATFTGSNFMNYTCPHCNKIFIKDIAFEDMVVYADDATRQQVSNILKMDTTSASNDEYPVDLYQISNSYVFGLRTPSIWNVIIETASLSDKFLERHADLIDIVSYIDSVYLINEEDGELVPIDTKPDPNDQAKTSARRIKTYYDIISKQLNTEEYYTLRSYINSYDEDATKLSYQIPACTCPDCATEIPANTNISPDNMLFTRHQLAAIGSM